MIFSNLNTFIQFVAAIYVTIALDDVLFNHFWTPNIHKSTLNILAQYKLDKKQILKNKFYNDMKARFQLLEAVSRRRGFFNVCICLFLLVYNVLLTIDSFYPSQYPFVIYLVISILSYFVMIGSSILCKRWFSFFVWVIIYFVVIIFLILFINSERVASPAINNLPDSSKVIIVVCLLLFPVLFQLILSWVYSKGYKRYLIRHISNEAKVYDSAIKAQENHDDSLIPEEYKDCFVSAVINITEDIQLTRIYECLDRRLRHICYDFNVFKIIKTLTLKDTFKDFEESHAEKLLDENEEITDRIDYNELAREYKSMGKLPKLKEFCKSKNIDESTFRQTLKTFNGRKL